jgi:WD40 repeat protein
MRVSEPRPTIDEQNPWPGLAPFEESAERFFNGRNEESAALRRLVLQAPLTVLFGASGLGKTSLLHAGLFPSLRKEALPVYVRLDLRDREAPLIEQVKAALEGEVRRRGVDAPEFGAGESLWEFLHRAGLELWSDQNQLLTPLFVLDQFEEVFTMGAANATAIAGLRTDLGDLIENRVPSQLVAAVLDREGGNDRLFLDSQHYKVLLSFREDFLPQMEGWKRDIPSILRNRLRLLPMSGEQAFEAVNKTAPHLAPEAVAWRIVAFAAAAGDAPEGSAGLEVAPALLSLVCAGLNQRRKEQGKAQFDEALLAGTGQAIVADFYRGSIAGVPEHVRRFIERELITERGFRKPCDYDDARTVHGVSEADLALLVNRRVLRIEPGRGTSRVELTHDLLTRVVREERDRQRELDRIAKERKQRRRLAGIVAALSAIAMAMASAAFYANGKSRQAQAALEALNKETEKTLAAQQGLAEQQTAAEVSKALASAHERAARSHQLAAEALSHLYDDDSASAMRSALQAIDATRTVDRSILPDAEDALRRAAFQGGEGLTRPGHGVDIQRIEFSPDARRLATVAEDGLRIWDLARGVQIQSFGGCREPVFSQDWTRLGCITDTGAVHNSADFLEVESGKVLWHVDAQRASRIDALSFSPNGTQMLWERGGTTYVSDGPAGRREFSGKHAVFSPDGEMLAAVVEPRGAKIWDFETGQEVRTWADEANHLTFRPDGKVLAIAGSKETNLLNIASGQRIAIAFGQSILDVPFDCMVFSRTDSRLFLVGDLVYLADSVTGQAQAIPQNVPVGEFRRSTNCEFSPDANVLVTHVVGRLNPEVWGRQLSRQTPDTGFYAVNADATLLASSDGASVTVTGPSGSKTTLLGYDPKTKLAVAAFSLDGGRMVTAGATGAAYVWDAASGRNLAILPGHQFPIYVVAFSPNGYFIITAGEQGVAKLWDARSGKLLHDLVGHGPRILSVSFSPDSKRVVTSELGGQTIVWDVATGADLTKGSPIRLQGNAHAAAFSPDGKRLFLGSGALSVRDAVSYREIQALSGNLDQWEGGFTMSRDGRFLAAAGTSSVEVSRAGSEWRHLPGSVTGSGPIPTGIAFSRDGMRLVTPGADRTVKIWDTASGREIMTLYYQGFGDPKTKDEQIKIRAVAFSPDERQIYAVGDNWSIFRFPVALDEVIAEANKRLAQR